MNIHNIEDHQYRGFNEALNCFVESKEHYQLLMKACGYVPFEKAQELAENARSKREFKLEDEDLRRFLGGLQSQYGRKGKIPMTPKLIKRLKDFGVTYDQFIPEHIKRDKPLTGGVS